LDGTLLQCFLGDSTYESRLFRNIQYDPSVSFPMGRNKAMKTDVGGSSMKLKILFCLFLLVVLLTGFGRAALAQITASIKGTVTDASGAVIAGAKIAVKNSALGIERNVESNSEGNYEVPALPPGTYSVEVQMQGFQRAIAKGVILAVSQNSLQNFSLQIASSDTIITV